MTAAVRDIPPDHTGGHALAREEIATTAETAIEQLQCVLPEQWQIIALREER
jgi:hypothetical protein